MRNIAKLLVIGLLIAAGLPTIANAGEKAVTVKLAGKIVKAKKGNGKPKWLIEFEDGKICTIRTPRDSAGFKLDDYIGKKAIFSFKGMETKEDGERKVTLVKTFPIAVEEVKRDEELPERDPDLEIPSLRDKKK